MMIMSKNTEDELICELAELIIETFEIPPDAAVSKAYEEYKKTKG